MVERYNDIMKLTNRTLTLMAARLSEEKSKPGGWSTTSYGAVKERLDGESYEIVVTSRTSCIVTSAAGATRKQALHVFRYALIRGKPLTAHYPPSGRIVECGKGAQSSIESAVY